MSLLRGARKIRTQSETSGEALRILLLAGGALVIGGTGFGIGYAVADRRAPMVIAAPPAFPLHDPLAALDAPERRPASRVEPAPSPPASAALEEVRRLEAKVEALARSNAPAAAPKPSATDAELRSALEASPQPVPSRALVEPSTSPPKPAPVVAAPAKAVASVEAAPVAAVAPPKPEVAEPTEVEVKAAAPVAAKEEEEDAAPASRPTPPAKAKKGRFTLQVRAYPGAERDKADELAEHLKQRGYKAYVASAKVEGRGTWHRVRVGRFGSREEAERFRSRLQKEENTPAFVTFVR